MSYEFIPGRYGYSVERSGPLSVIGRMPLAASLVDGDGAMSTAAVLMAFDMSCGMAAGLGVLPKWTVTADVALHVLGRCTVGPLRVDATAVRSGRTMSVAEAVAVDEGADDALVAIATANHGVLDSSFDHFLETDAAGTVRTFPKPDRPADESLADYFGLAVVDGAATMALGPRSTNPWGIFHGGLTGLLVDAAARSHGLRQVDDVNLRFLRAVKEGPARATVTRSFQRGDQQILGVEVRDVGADRAAVIGEVTGH